MPSLFDGSGYMMGMHGLGGLFCRFFSPVFFFSAGAVTRTVKMTGVKRRTRCCSDGWPVVKSR